MVQPISLVCVVKISLKGLSHEMNLAFDDMGHFLNFLGAKSVFLAANASYVGLIMLVAYICHSSTVITIGVYGSCSLIKVDWLAACIALTVVGAVLVVFLRRWRKICTILQLMGSKG